MNMIILDRDGVINQEIHHSIHDRVTCPSEWRAIPGSLEAIRNFYDHGYKVIVVTNQSGIGRGMYSLEALDAIHQKMNDQVEAIGGKIDRIYFCPHKPNSGCFCRKPEPGMFHQIQKDYDVDLSQTYFIGDSFSDYQASLAVGCQFGLVLTGKGQKTRTKIQDKNVKIFKDLLEVSKVLLKK